MKILFIDAETAPAMVYTFSLFKPMIGLDQVIEPSRIMCFTAKWYDKKQVIFKSEYHDSRQEMLQSLHDLLDEAEVIVTYNGKRFDTPWITGELITAGFLPPSPFEQVDLYQIVRANMRNISNKLDHVSDKLLGERKVSHTGFRLWRDCLAGDPRAWALMKKYNIQDVKLMPPLYDILKPWMRSHPNHAARHDIEDATAMICPTCDSTNVQRRGFAFTKTAKYRRYQCQDCGKWLRDKRSLFTTELREA